MKKEALKRGAEEAPISLTWGMEDGRGVVSIRTCWLNLGIGVSGGFWRFKLWDILGLAGSHGGKLLDGSWQWL